MRNNGVETISEIKQQYEENVHFRRGIFLQALQFLRDHFDEDAAEEDLVEVLENVSWWDDAEYHCGGAVPNRKELVFAVKTFKGDI